jgi:hypothetical protein
MKGAPSDKEETSTSWLLPPAVLPLKQKAIRKYIFSSGSVVGDGSFKAPVMGCSSGEGRGQRGIMNVNHHCIQY